MSRDNGQRLAPEVLGFPEEVCDLPVEKLRHGYYADKYFQRTKRILEVDEHHPELTMQVFCKKDAVIGGIDAAIAVLKAGIGQYQDSQSSIVPLEEKMENQNGHWVNKFGEVEVMALFDGDKVAPKVTQKGIEYKTVMTIVGDYSLFAHLETDYLGLMARGTRIATNVKNVVDAAGETPVLFFPARFDSPTVQTADGYAARVGGAFGVSTDAQAQWWGGEALGTVPHGLIAAYRGDTVKATLKFAEIIDPKVKVISLVDYKNDCVGTSLDVAKAFQERGWLDRLFGVRLDTGESMIDRSLQGNEYLGQFKPTGVCIPLVYNVRNGLDGRGFKTVQVGVSGGFNVPRINEFKELGVPVGFYGVGSSLFEGKYDFTADIVRYKVGAVWQPESKVGRVYRSNDDLSKVT